jgi:hypothetical protein
MSKKKNTLKDLDEFLKQQAATLVSPPRLSQNTEPSGSVFASPTQPDEDEKSQPVQKTAAEKIISTSSLVTDLKRLALIKGTGFTEELSDVVLSAMEKQNEFSPEEKMLINTALYLKHGSDWKDAIRQYWKSKNS